MMHSFIDILRRALDEEMTRDAAVHLLGEDVAAGGAFGVTRGLADKHGHTRVRNTPISESAITGVATGAALCGLRPVLEIMFIDFATLAMDCLVNQTAKYRYMSGGQLTVPLVVRTQAGAAGGAAAQHSQSLEAWFIHVPGLVVVAPSSPVEAYGLLKSAIRLGEPVLFIEHKRLYTMKEALADGVPLPPIGQARIAKAGTDVSLIAYSAMVQTALEAAQTLAHSGISAEVIDLRTLLPLDMATIAASVSRTHRALIAHEAVLNGGFGAEIAARIGNELFDELDTPVERVGCPFAPIPFAPDLERALLPGSKDIVRAVRRMPGLGARTAGVE
jgi:acetoin:2,6-dichlorophenolindophenol oxidoreductase subunit beta